MPAAVRLSGALEASALGASLEEILRRHEALRTSFRAVEGTPRQEIAETAGFELPVIDLAGPPADGEASRLAAAETARGFDLERGPLLRARLLRLGRDEHLLVVVMHHIVSDGWSMFVLLRELVALGGEVAVRLGSGGAEVTTKQAAAVASRWIVRIGVSRGDSSHPK